MKKIILLISTAVLFSSCGTTFQHIGSLSVASTRNFSTKESYVLISSKVGNDYRDLKKIKGKTIDEAITFYLNKYPNAEFITNCKIYLLGDKYAVSGDVWGYPQKYRADTTFNK